MRERVAQGYAEANGLNVRALYDAKALLKPKGVLANALALRAMSAISFVMDGVAHAANEGFVLDCCPLQCSIGRQVCAMSCRSAH